jgi:hypothetical protein
MAFLDNSGDIILDAVLTDTGRMRLARGDGSFRIAKFALGDDEIDYGLFDKLNVNGSEYYDLQCLQTPVLEAFTNNTSLLNSKLITISNNMTWYLPIIKLFNQGSSTLYNGTHFIVLADQTTVDQITLAGTVQLVADGILNGATVGGSQMQITTDQGLDTANITPDTPLNPELVETAYIVEMDNRLGKLFPGITGQGTNPAAASLSPLSYSFIDDDSVASYYISMRRAGLISTIATGLGINSSILGPRGTRLSFRIGSSLENRSGYYLFDTFGNVGTTTITNDTVNLVAGTYKYIDSTIRVSGVSTGYRIDIPVRYVKYIL